MPQAWLRGQWRCRSLRGTCKSAFPPPGRCFPEPIHLVRYSAGDDEAAIALEAEIQQWRRVPDEAILQAVGLYKCGLNVADAGFLERIGICPAYSPSEQPPREDSRHCRTGEQDILVVGCETQLTRALTRQQSPRRGQYRQGPRRRWAAASRLAERSAESSEFPL